MRLTGSISAAPVATVPAVVPSGPRLAVANALGRASLAASSASGDARAALNAALASLEGVIALHDLYEALNEEIDTIATHVGLVREVAPVAEAQPEWEPAIETATAPPLSAEAIATAVVMALRGLGAV